MPGASEGWGRGQLLSRGPCQVLARSGPGPSGRALGVVSPPSRVKVLFEQELSLWFLEEAWEQGEEPTTCYMSEWIWHCP